jgi:two-component system, chemotaxis family, sensor histidine kinase and response regulator PixL
LGFGLGNTLIQNSTVWHSFSLKIQYGKFPMMSDPKIHEQTYSYFLIEAQDLLQAIEQNLLTLQRDRSPAKVHDLMRSAHTLKGAAASVGFNGMKSIAHSLEDIFKALYKPEVTIDAELEALLFEGYECLRLPLTTAMAGKICQDTELLDRAETIFKRIRAKLGNHFTPGAAILNSSDLGFDITRSLFESGVRDRLEQLATAVETGEATTIAQSLQTQAEVFIGLAESLNLPGFGAIAQAARSALQKQPDRVLEIAQAALADFRQGQLAIVDGDRTSGGQVSDTLKQLAGGAKQLSHANEKDWTERAMNAPRKAWNRLKAIFDHPMISEPGPNLEAPQSALTTSERLDDLDLDALTEFADSFEEVASESLSQTTDSGFELWEDEPTEMGSIPSELEEMLPTVSEVKALPSLEEPIIQMKAAESIPQKPVPVKTTTPEIPLENQSPTLRSTVRVDLEHLDSLNSITSELLIHQNQQILQDERLQLLLVELLDRLKHHQQVLSQLRDWSDWSFVASEKVARVQNSEALIAETAVRTNFDTLELDRYDDLHLLLQSALDDSERLETEIEAIGFLARESRLARSKQGRLLTNLRDDLMTVRMMPIGMVLNRFPAVVQQLMETYGKQVELRLVGTQVLIDKALAEKLYDPLLHLVRNAFDHGIESEDVRRQQGKSAVGCIEIRAYQQGNRTFIDVRDNGQGLDLQRICRRGFELKLLPSTQVEHFSRTDLLNLMFETGFSTAEQVTDLSGRGVGLDVVRSQIRSLQGNITVTSEVNQGTTFSLQLPLTLMTARLLVCQSGRSVYGLLSDEVERILSTGTEQIEIVGNRKILHLQQDGEECAIPVQSLSDLVPYKTWSAGMIAPVQHEEALSPVPTLNSPILLLNGSSGQIGLQIDRILGEQELVIRPISDAIVAPNYIYGCSVLGDGRLLLVIDGLALVGKAAHIRQIETLPAPEQSMPVKESHPSKRLQPVPPPPPKISPTKPVLLRRQILVIDDSMTLRQALKLALESGGYDVIQAKDGLDAIEQLKKHPNIQLITCDVEMPRMNGFEFLMQYRQEPGLPDVPILMLTSRTNEKHKQLAMQLGAAAYLTKPFDEEGLLEVVDQFIQKVKQ